MERLANRNDPEAGMFHFVLPYAWEDGGDGDFDDPVFASFHHVADTTPTTTHLLWHGRQQWLVYNQCRRRCATGVGGVGVASTMMDRNLSSAARTISPKAQPRTPTSVDKKATLKATRPRVENDKTALSVITSHTASQPANDFFRR